MASVASSKGTITTGSVKVERPKLREPSRGVSVQSLKVAVVEPSRPNSQASIQCSEVAPSARAGGRSTGQHAKVSELGDRVAHTSRGSLESSLESSGRSVKVRSSSMSEVETGCLTGSERESRQKASIRSRSNSQSRASNIRASSSVGDEEEALDQRATVELPEELKLKQREVAARISVASSATSSTMEHSTSRMKKLFESASDNTRLSVSSEAEKLDDTKARASVATVSSNSSNLRRLDIVIGQLEFDEMMSS